MSLKNKQYIFLVTLMLLFAIPIVMWANVGEYSWSTQINVVKEVDLQLITPMPAPSSESEPEPLKSCHKKLRLVNPPGVVTGLSTFPGSGNTWTRHLIQEATG